MVQGYPSQDSSRFGARFSRKSRRDCFGVGRLKQVLVVKIFLYNVYFRLHCLKNWILDSYSLSKNSPTFDADLLLIKIDAIGDYILWQDSLRAYKKKYVGKKVVLLCSQTVRPIALLDPFFFEVWAIDRKKFIFSFLYRFEFIKRLRSYRFKEVVSPVFSREYAYCDQLVKMIISPVKIGYTGDVSNMSIKEQKKGNRYYTKLVDKAPHIVSELLINAHFVQQVCDVNFMPQLPILYEEKAIDKIVADNRYVVFSISASYYPRAWSPESFAKVADLISNNYTIVLLGYGEMDRKKGDEFLRKVSNPSMVKDLINETSLLETINIIRNASFVIGNDSSAVHIAAATRTPSICIAPGAHYNRFVPYPIEIPDKFYHPRVVASPMPCFGCNYHCCFPVMNQLKCVQDVTVSMVARELNDLLDEINNSKYESTN